jgi:hypothetical protein
MSITRRSYLHATAGFMATLAAPAIAVAADPKAKLIRVAAS